MTDIGNNFRGFNDYNTTSSEYNALRFMLDSVLTRLHTAFLVKVIGVYPEKKLVDAFPVIQGVDTNGKTYQQAPIYRLPYLQLQGGSNTIILTPETGDYGLCVVSERDITEFKKTRREQIKN